MPKISEFISSTAPLVAIGAAWSYFTGVSYQSYLLGFFGLPADMLQHGVQQMMAIGFQAMLTAFAMPLLISLASIGVRACYRRIRGYDRHHPTVIAAQRKRRPYVIVYMFIFTIASGWLMGMIAAGQDYSKIVIRTENGCKTCFLYNTVKGRVVGVPLGQDNILTLLVTRKGVAILPANGIKAARPINERARLPWWMIFALPE